MRRLKGAIFAVLLFSLPFVSLVEAAAAPPTRITAYAITAAATRFDPLRPRLGIAVDKGFFAQENLLIETPMLAMGTVPAAIASGSANIAATGIGIQIDAYKAGVRTMIAITGDVIAPVYQLVARPEIRTIDDLRGKKVGIPSLASDAAQVIQVMLSVNGLEPGRDYTLVQAGGSTERVTGLLARAFDATVLFPPSTYVALDAGMNLLRESRLDIPRHAPGTIVVNTLWAQRNRPVVVRFLKALMRAGQWLSDPKNKDEAISIIANNLVVGGKTIGEKRAAEYYRYFVEEGRITVTGYVPDNVVRDTIGIAVRTGAIATRDWLSTSLLFDWSYLQEAARQLNLPVPAR